MEIRFASRPEVELALDWAAREGWNPGLRDGAPFHAADPEGFLLGFVDGQPVALISAVRYGREFGFVGFYIVHPDWRCRGLGWAIWQQAMARLAGRNVALDGVLAEQDNYRRGGFKLAWRNVRYEGRTVASSPRETVGVTPCRLSDLPWVTVARYDSVFFPADRSAFLESWISQPGSQAMGLLRDGRLVASGVIRPCRTGYKIGPLFADDAALAEQLFHALLGRVQSDEPLFLDVPECNAEAVALARRHGMTPCFKTARMYTGPVPDISLPRTFGITSFELG
jgi:hypothetical protein